MIITNETIVSFNPTLEHEAMMKFEEQHQDWKKEETTFLYSYRQRNTVNTFNALQYVESVGEKKDCVEIVRCKDCKHLYEERCPLRTWFTHTEDDYCSYGERKEKE